MLLRHKRNKIIARDMKSAVITHCGRVAISKHAHCNKAHLKLFESTDVRAIVFTHGYDIGVLIHPDEKLPANHLALAKLAQEAGELPKWKPSYDGKIFSWGNDIEHAYRYSEVKPEAIALTLSRLLSGKQEE
jgi:hypothetical protein